MAKSEDNVVAKSSSGVPEEAKKLRVETTMQRAEAAAYFEALARGIRQGELTIRSEGSQLSMAVGESPTVKVKAARKKGEGHIEFSLSWKED